MEEKREKGQEGTPKEVKKTTIYHFPSSEDSKKEEEVAPFVAEEKISILKRIYSFILGLFSKKEFKSVMDECEEESPNSLTSLEYVRMDKKLYRFVLTERKLILKKDIFDNISFTSNSVPFLVKSGRLINVYFSAGAERTFPDREEIEKNIGASFEEQNDLVFAGNLEEVQKELTKICLERKMRSDQAFVKHCLLKDLINIERLKEGCGSNKSQTSSGDKTNLMREDFRYFEILKHLFGLEGRFYQYFDSDHLATSIKKAFVDFFETYESLEADLRVFEKIYGFKPKERFFDRAERIFYGFDRLIPKLETILGLNSRRVQFAPYKKSLIPEKGEADRFIQIIEEEQKILQEIKRIFGEWKKIRTGWACWVDFNSFQEISVCQRRHRETIKDNKGNISERDFCCCEKQGESVLGPCWLDRGEKPDYCIQ